MRISHTSPPSWPAIASGRFARDVRTDSPEGCQIALLGLPDDTGVRLNFGRPGAQAGPAAFRAALASFGTRFDSLRRRALDVSVFDAGDVEPALGDDESALSETHRRVEAAALELHARGLVVVAVGGGHDLSLPTLRALSRHEGRKVGGINVDAHLDVRQRVGSGMPFRRLIDGGFVEPRSFVEVGVGRFASDQSDFEWLLAQGGEVILAEQVLASGVDGSGLMAHAARPGSAFLSVDLDGLDATVAPGVSARNPAGLSVAQVAPLCEAAGACPAIAHFDLMELCPARDADDRTARSAAYLFLSFVAGFVGRMT